MSRLNGKWLKESHTHFSIRKKCLKYCYYWLDQCLKRYMVQGNHVLFLELPRTVLPSAPAILCHVPHCHRQKQGEGQGFQQQHLKRAGPEKS